MDDYTLITKSKLVDLLYPNLTLKQKTKKLQKANYSGVELYSVVGKYCCERCDHYNGYCCYHYYYKSEIKIPKNIDIQILKSIYE